MGRATKRWNPMTGEAFNSKAGFGKKNGDGRLEQFASSHNQADDRLVHWQRQAMSASRNATFSSAFGLTGGLVCSLALWAVILAAIK